jgi:hypothetical protein
MQIASLGDLIRWIRQGRGNREFVGSDPQGDVIVMRLVMMHSQEMKRHLERRRDQMARECMEMVIQRTEY